MGLSVYNLLGLVWGEMNLFQVMFVQFYFFHDNVSSDDLEIYLFHYCQAPGPGLDQPGPQPGLSGHQMAKPSQGQPVKTYLALTLTKSGPDLTL